MSKPAKVAVIVGSLRKDSFSRKTAKAIAALAPAHLTFDFVGIGDLALYNQDYDALSPQPAPYVAFRDALKAADAVLFVTPEYNRSVPGVLKNALDVGSRPWGHSVFKRKPAAVVSVSPGALGGFGANHHLRQTLSFLDMPTLDQPEMYVGHAGDLFGADGALKKEETKAFFKSFVDAFAAWIDKTRA
jgi:chromate reductase